MSQVADTWGCLNGTIKVASGHYVDLYNPDPATIDINSIAKALSKVCRFGGHCPAFYSVAEHCVLAYYLAELDGVSLEGQRAVLLHDAAEAYIGDMVKPLKVSIPEYAVAEKRIEAAIQKRFGVDFAEHAETIKTYDRAMLKAEKTQMWPSDTEVWSGFSDIPDRQIEISYWGSGSAEYTFMRVATSLGLST